MPTLHILGAGTPSPTPDRFGTTCALRIGDDLLMVDCGPAATQKLVCAGLFPTQVGWLFFTHHHSDHNAGYPCLQLVRWDHCTGGEGPLRVFGPPPTEELTSRLFGAEGAFADDFRARIEHPASHRCHLNRGGSLPRPGPVLDARNVEPGDLVEGDDWTARCSAAEHVEPWLTSLAWRFDWPGGSVAFTGDTRPCQSVLRLAANVGTLVANCPLRQSRLHPELGTCIYGTGDAAQAARDARADRLVLIHLTESLVRERDDALAEMCEVYDGEIIFADELSALEM